MGIPGSRYSHDFGGPSVIVHGASGAGGTGSVLKTCQIQDGEYKVTKRWVVTEQWIVYPTTALSDSVL